MEEDLKDKFDQQTKDIYSTIGEFAVQFEHVCHYMKLIIMTILAKEGLTNERVLHVLLADYTAEPLRGLVLSLLNETHNLSQADKKIVEWILNRVQKLTGKRNDVIHGTWFIGWAHYEDTEFKDAPGIKFHKNKKGASTKNFKWQEESFSSLTAEAINLWNLLVRLNGCLAGNFQIEKNFIVSPKGEVQLPKKMYE